MSGVLLDGESERHGGEYGLGLNFCRTPSSLGEASADLRRTESAILFYRGRGIAGVHHIVHYCIEQVLAERVHANGRRKSPVSITLFTLHRRSSSTQTEVSRRFNAIG